MKINIEKNLVEFTPENADETAKLESLWRLMVDCVRFNKKLVPVGEYIPANNDFARFAIEGLESGSTDDYPEVYVDQDCRRSKAVRHLARSLATFFLAYRTNSTEEGRPLR